MNWYKKNNSWFADLPGENNKALVSTGSNGKWWFAFNIGNRVWDSDPVLQPFEFAETAKQTAEGMYQRVKQEMKNQ